MTASVSRSLNMLCIIVKIITFFIIMVQLHAKVGISLTCGEHLHGRNK